MNILSFTNSYLYYKTKHFYSISEFINTFNLYENNLKLYFIKSIKFANFDQLLPFFENYVNFCCVDVIVLTETWHDVNLGTYNLPSFQIFCTNVKKNQMIVLSF